MKIRIKEIDKIEGETTANGQYLAMFVNLTPGSIHNTVDSPEGFKDHTDWFWVMGARNLPVRIMPDEFEEVVEK